MNHRTTGVDATIDALKEPTGAVPNGRLKPEPRRRKVKQEERNREVKQSRPPVDPWECDDCMTRGNDFTELQHHVELTGHTLFSKR